MSESVIHSFLLSNFNIPETTTLNLKLPRKDYFLGLWEICIPQIAYVCKENLNEFVILTSNFVTDVKFNDNNDLEKFESHLSFVALKGNVNEKKSFFFDKTWFCINSMSDNLKIEIINPQTNKTTTAKFELYVTVLLRRIK